MHANRDETWQLAHLMDPVTIAPVLHDPSSPRPRAQITLMQAQMVLAYLRRVRAGAVPPQLTESDRLATVTFSEICVTCHRISGEGGQSAPNLSRVGARHDAAAIRRILIDPASEFPGATMPIFSGRLSEQQIDALTQYLVRRR
jgi:mono/diheme cytochrome c family protein